MRPGTYQFHLINQLKCITRVKLLRGFVLKVATLGPHLSFYKRNAITTAGFTIWYSARAPRSDGKTFLVFTYIWQEDVANIPKVPAAPCNVNRSGNDMVSKRNYLMYHFSITLHLLTDKFDVLRDRLLGNHKDFHWQLGGQINHQPCSYKAARVIRCTELDSAVSSF